MATTEIALEGAERSRAPTATCAHCGLVVPPGRRDPSAAHQFCCQGCSTVWSIIHEHGLERFYRLRAPAPARPARTSERTYEELDDPTFQARACRVDAGGVLTTELHLEGVHCGACLWLLEKLPRAARGVIDARLDLVRSRLTVRWNPREIRLSGIARQLDSLGYRPHAARGLREEEIRRREDRAMLARIGVAGAVAGNVMAIAFALYGGLLHGMEPEYATLFRWASLIITLPALVWGGGVFFRGAWAALRTRSLHMDLPISVGLLAGFGHGVAMTMLDRGHVYFDSITALIFLLLVGRYLQRRQQRAATDAAELLLSLAPSTARVVQHGVVREVPLEALRPGELVEVRPGELLPADGVVVEGHSALDLSLLTGESRPVAVAPGAHVHAGTVNLSARLEVAVEQTGDATRIGRLLRLVESHARRRAPIVELADRISGIFVAAVLCLAAITLSIWLALDPTHALEHAIALLIVTCPCALGLATPLAVSAAVGRAARSGVLVKGTDVFEKLARPGRLWLDKTGTLTPGRLTLVRWEGDEAARPLVAALERHSTHPIGRALGQAADRADVVADAYVEETPGGGVEGTVGQRQVLVGSPAFVARRLGPLDPDRAHTLDAITAEGLTPVLVAVDGRVRAVAGLGDPLRDDAVAAVAELRARGWKVGILSGDHPAVVAAVGRALGLEAAACRGAVSPEDKARQVAADARQGPVVMVGDGVNDAAALAAATVGVGVSGGAEAVLDAADVFLTRRGVMRLVELVDGAHRAMRVVRRNLVFSLAYNAVGVTLAMAGVLNPLLAALLMPASSLTVVASSYRARTFTPVDTEVVTWE